MLYHILVKHEKTPHCAPLLGGCAGALLLLIMTRFQQLWLGLIPMVIDLGCITLVVRFFIRLLRSKTKDEQKRP